MKIAAYVVGIAVLVVSVSVVAGCRCGSHGQGDDQAAAHHEKGDAAAVKQKLCPVMGEKVDRSSYVDHAGKRIYFCCPKCVGAFKSDPDKFMKKLQTQKAVLENSPKMQPAHESDGDHAMDMGEHAH